MKKIRLLIAVLAVILLVTSLVGCEKKEGNDCDVQISCTEEYVSLYTEKECKLTIYIDVKSGEKIETISRTFTFTGDMVRNLIISDFTDKYDNQKVTIVDAYYEKAQNSYEELHIKASIFTFLLGLTLAVIGTVYILTYPKPILGEKKRKSIKKP